MRSSEEMNVEVLSNVKINQLSPHYSLGRSTNLLCTNRLVCLCGQQSEIAGVEAAEM